MTVLKRWTGTVWDAAIPLTADDPQFTLSGAVNPAAAVFQQVVQQQMLDPLPAIGDDAVVHEQRFLNVTAPVGGYTQTLNGGSAAPASVTVDGGALTITAPATALDVSYSLPQNPCAAPFFFVRARLESVPNSGTVEVGIVNPTSGDRYCFQYVKDSGGVASLKWTQRISGTTTAFAVGTPPSTIPATPVAIALLVAGKNQWSLIQYDNGSIHACGISNPSVDIRTTANFAAFRPHFGVSLPASAVAKIGSFSVGYPGGLGVVNHRLVTYDDGTPYLRRGKYFFTTTLANSGSYDGEHCAVMSFDPYSLRYKIVCRMFFPTGSQLGSLYAGSLTFNQNTGVWTALMSSWGVGTWTTDGVDTYFAQTTDDVLDGRSVAVMPAALLPLNTGSGAWTNGSYDPALRYDPNTSTYYVAVTETSARTSFQQWPALYSGSSLTNLTRVAHDTTNNGENPNWVRMNGAWWLIFSWGNGIVQYDPTTLANRTVLSNWPQTTPDSFGTLTHGAAVLPVPGAASTTYYMLTWDGSKIGTNDGTEGGNLITRCTTVANGHEFPRRRLLRA